MEPVRFGVVGVGGYAQTHIRAVETLERKGLGRLISVVIRNPEKYREEETRLRGKNVEVYRSFEEMLEGEAGRVEIVALPVAIHQHKEMTIAALKAGYNVIVEKPPAVTIQDLDEMIRAEREAPGFCAVGFQSQSNRTIQALKKLVCDGKLGEIREVIAKGRWRRLDSYYQRNAWAGKFIHEGKYILDGTVANPLSHYLLNGLYFASQEPAEAALPVKVRAELYRAHRIEGEDTSCIEIEAENGARVFFYGTLCAPKNEEPIHEIVGSRGVARWVRGQDAYVEYCDGEVEIIEKDKSDPRIEVFRNAARFLRGIDEMVNCPLSLTRPFVLALNGAYESAGTIRSIPDRYLTIGEEEGSVSTTINDIVRIIDEAAEQRKLYSDLGVEWAYPTQFFSLKDYKRFEMKN